jgi:hypothetical protein
MPASSPWYLLIHQLPPRPLYLRAKIGNRLEKVGAVALKNSVYVLPGRSDCLEDFQWIAQEAIAGGGEAWVCAAAFQGPSATGALRARFQAQADTAYEALGADLRQAIREARGRTPAGSPEERAAGLTRLRKRLEEVRGIDFFGAPRRKEIEALMEELERLLHRTAPDPAGSSRRGLPGLTGRVWVTRRGIKVDRMSTAWLVRRFVNPRARFRFVDPGKESPAPGEISFDMSGGDVTHEGDRCTFETLLARTKSKDPGLRAIGEIVHDLDLKDGKYGRPEAAGIRALIDGIVRSHAADTRRLEAGLELFDVLYASLREAPGAPPRGRRPRARRRPPRGR